MRVLHWLSRGLQSCWLRFLCWLRSIRCTVRCCANKFYMENSAFWRGLGLVTLAVSALIGGFATFLVDSPGLLDVSVGIIALFVLICTTLYFVGRKAAKSSSKVAFNGLISISVFGKMLLSVAFLLIYQKFAQPTDNWYVGVFLVAYAAYTGFEVWFMQKLARL